MDSHQYVLRALRAAGLGLALGASGGCLSSCFARGTRISTPRGRRPIEDLVVGDEVWSYSLRERRPVIRRVTAALRASASEFFTVTAGEWSTPAVTAEHPFWDDAVGDWCTVAQLTLGSRLLVWRGEGDDVRSLPMTSLARVRSNGAVVEVFNLTIEGGEANYFAEGILVHNKSVDASPNNPDGAAAIACTGTFEEVQARIPMAMAGSRCPTRWEDLPTTPCSGATMLPPRAGLCGDMLVYQGACSLDHFVCAYDPTTHVLLGVRECTDTPSYCNQTSSCIAAGTLPGETTLETCNSPTIGADAGADASGDGGG